MKKNNEGYVLVFVVVVMLVLALVATAVMTFSLHSLKSQQNSIQRTQDQYAAGGEIEKVVALLKNSAGSVALANVTDAAQSGDTLSLTSTCNPEQGSCVLSVKAEKGSEQWQITEFVITAACGTVQIVSKLDITASVTISEENGTKVYSISNATFNKYTSYQITTVTQEETTTGGGET